MKYPKVKWVRWLGRNDNSRKIYRWRITLGRGGKEGIVFRGDNKGNHLGKECGWKREEVAEHI